MMQAEAPMRRFVMYRRDIPAGTHDKNQMNKPDEPQFEGVVYSDGKTAIRWLTGKRSVAVWDSFDDMMAIHGHPEYKSELKWLDNEEKKMKVAQTMKLQVGTSTIEVVMQAPAPPTMAFISQSAVNQYLNRVTTEEEAPIHRGNLSKMVSSRYDITEKEAEKYVDKWLENRLVHSHQDANLEAKEYGRVDYRKLAKDYAVIWYCGGKDIRVDVASTYEEATDKLRSLVDHRHSYNPCGSSYKQEAHQHSASMEAQLAQLGRTSWSQLHQWAANYQAEVAKLGSTCGCGDFAVHAMQAVHDVVNVQLGKKVEHLESLEMLRTAMSAMSTEGMVSIPSKLARDILGFLKEQNMRHLFIELQKYIDVLDDFGRKSSTRQEQQVQLSSGFLDLLLGGAATAAGATIAGYGVSKLLGAVPMTSPEAGYRIIDDRKSTSERFPDADKHRDPEEKDDDDKNKSKKLVGVLSPSKVEGDQAEIDTGKLLEEVKNIITTPSRLGEVDGDTLRVVRQGS